MRIGIDLVEIERIKGACKNARFTQRVYTAAERDYADGSFERLSGMWAAKEAAAKALGTGVRGFGLADIEVAHDDMGAPFLRLYNGAERLRGERKMSLSITHSKTTAAAVVILEE